MENRFIWVTMTFTFIVFFVMTGISIGTYQKQVAEVKALHTKFENRELEIKQLTVELVKNKEDMTNYKNVIESYEQKIEEYEQTVSRLQTEMNTQQKSIQEVKSQVNF
ncbi:hypothetical protein BEP19_08230 [Ammoniphilus oxalaticus]|uniref:Uncharacterized protein n=1 Tax=Ammoniphilus oxalaticus TaxID=66863 RepID=A0A419SK65_9BACL|nr:hypothetical protein [Ammoniphilus oxalaticus]RKD24372.1 hypothetical protein BEP19_08230 [Ammoniphilus oxalaticus]